MVSSHICVILHLSEFFQGFPAFFYCDSPVEKSGKIQIILSKISLGNKIR